MEERITIAVIIPTYNRGILICNTLDSVLQQTVPFDEIIVVDDASTDTTINVLKEYTLKSKLIKVLKQKKNTGAQAARNRGILEAKSDFVLLLDSDNTLVENYVERIRETLRSNATIDVLTNYSAVIDVAGRRLQEDDFKWVTKGLILKSLLVGDTYVDNSSACIRRQKLLDIELLDEKCPSFQEWDTHIRLAKNSNYDYLPEFLTNYLCHDGERISASAHKLLGRGLYVLKRHKKMWLSVAGRNIYCHYLTCNYDVAKKNNGILFTFRVFCVIVSIYPKAARQILKRGFKRFFSRYE